MEQRFTILALQGRNFHRMPDGFRLSQGGDGGPERVGRLAKEKTKQEKIMNFYAFCEEFNEIFSESNDIINLLTILKFSAQDSN